MLTTRSSILAFTALALLAGSACAQTAPSGVACPSRNDPAAVYRTFYLPPATTLNHFTQVQTVLRNMLQRARIDGASTQQAIGICGTPADMELAQKIIADMDRPAPTGQSWRLAYTFTHGSNVHKAVLVVAPGGEGALKEGQRVPIVTGTSRGSDQYQYVDIGLNISADVENTWGPARLRTKVERSDISQQKPGAGINDPVIGQTVLETTTLIAPGKPMVLGTLNLPNGGKEEVSVTAEPVQ